MKVLVSNYTIDNVNGFIEMNVDPTGATTPNLSIESLLLITKVTPGTASQIIYNFASSNGSWTVSGNKLYSYLINGLSSTDELQIYYDYTPLNAVSPQILIQEQFIKSNTDVMKALLTTLTDLTDSMYNVAEKLRILDAVRDNAANIRVQPTGGVVSTINQLSGIIGDFTSTSTTAGYLRVGALTSRHNSAAQININNIIP